MNEINKIDKINESNKVNKINEIKIKETSNNIAGKKTAFLNLGCKVNSYETEAMRQMFIDAGAEIIDFSEKADIYIVNTCTVTNIADRKSRQMLHKAKKNNPNALVIAAGCYVQSSKEELADDIAVDLLIGNNIKKQIIDIVNEYLADNSSVNVIVEDISQQMEYESLKIETVFEKTRAYIKIQDGCNQFCSYCIIPYARGRSRSRDENDILDEAVRIAQKGYKEIVLTGIHLSSYGIDKMEKSHVDKSIPNDSLLLLLEKLDKINGIERIRLSSLEPRIITDDFVIRLSKLNKICPHFHLSMQSGCDATLKRMNRKYTTKQYMDGCILLRKYFDNPALTTDVIVGFPGETKEEFLCTKVFIKNIAFAQMHVFKYSKRKGTAADKMKEQVLDDIKAARSEELISLSKELSHKFEEAHYGKVREVLFEEDLIFDGVRYMTGYTREYIKVIAKTELDIVQKVKKVRIVDHFQKELLLSEILD